MARTGSADERVDDALEEWALVADRCELSRDEHQRIALVRGHGFVHGSAQPGSSRIGPT